MSRASHPVLVWLAWFLAAGVGLAALADRWFGVDVTILSRTYDKAEREEARLVFDDEADDPAELYGLPERGTMRVVLRRSHADPRLITPEEAPHRRLLPVDRAGGARPPEARWVWWAGYVMSTIGVLMLLVLGWRRRRVAGRRVAGRRVAAA